MAAGDKHASVGSILEPNEMSVAIKKGEIKILQHITNSIYNLSRANNTTSESLLKSYKIAKVMIDQLIYKKVQEQTQGNMLRDDFYPYTWGFWSDKFASETYLNFHIQRKHPQHRNQNKQLDFNDLLICLRRLESLHIPFKLKTPEIDKYCRWISQAIASLRDSSNLMNIDFQKSDEEFQKLDEETIKQSVLFSLQQSIVETRAKSYFPATKHKRYLSVPQITLDQYQNVFEMSYEHINQFKTLEGIKKPLTGLSLEHSVSVSSLHSVSLDESVSIIIMDSVTTVKVSDELRDYSEEITEIQHVPNTNLNEQQSFSSGILSSECVEGTVEIFKYPQTPFLPSPFYSSAEERPPDSLDESNQIFNFTRSEITDARIRLNASHIDAQVDESVETAKFVPAAIQLVHSFSTNPKPDFSGKSVKIENFPNSNFMPAPICENQLDTSDLSNLSIPGTPVAKKPKSAQQPPPPSSDLKRRLALYRKSRITSVGEKVAQKSLLDTEEIEEEQPPKLLAELNYSKITPKTTIDINEPVLLHPNEFPSSPSFAETIEQFTTQDIQELKIELIPSIVPKLQPSLGMSQLPIRLDPLMSPQSVANIIDSIPAVYTSQSPTATDSVELTAITAPTRSEQSPTSADTVQSAILAAQKGFDKVQRSGKRKFQTPVYPSEKSSDSQEEASLPFEVTKFDVISIARKREKFEQAVNDIGMNIEKDQAYYYLAERYASEDNPDLAYFQECYSNAKDIDMRIRKKNEKLQTTQENLIAHCKKYTDTIPLKWRPKADLNQTKKFISKYLENKINETEDYSTQIDNRRIKRSRLMLQSEIGLNIVGNIEEQCENLETIRKAVPWLKLNQFQNRLKEIADPERKKRSTDGLSFNSHDSSDQSHFGTPGVSPYTSPISSPGVFPTISPWTTPGVSPPNSQGSTPDVSPQPTPVQTPRAVNASSMPMSREQTPQVSRVQTERAVNETSGLMSRGHISKSSSQSMSLSMGTPSPDNPISMLMARVYRAKSSSSNESSSM